MIFALIGNQNCGKTTLFNQLTGSNQHVGNFPGVTVERKEGVIKKHPDMIVVDLPGIYSLSPYTSEEVVTRDFLLKDKPDGIINIVDATNIERNLYLSLQLMELNGAGPQHDGRGSGKQWLHRYQAAVRRTGRALRSHFSQQKRRNSRADPQGKGHRKRENSAPAAGFLPRPGA